MAVSGHIFSTLSTLILVDTEIIVETVISDLQPLVCVDIHMYKGVIYISAYLYAISVASMNPDNTDQFNLPALQTDLVEIFITTILACVLFEYCA